MRYTLTDRILLLVNDYFDFLEATFSLRNAYPYILGDPAFHKHRMWTEKYLSDKKKRKKLTDILYMLYKRKILKRVTISGLEGYVLHQRGKMRVAQIRALSAKKKKLPNHQWLLIFFDIPEKQKKIREHFRILLKSMGFQQLQKSVWMTPYDVIRDIKKAILEYGISKNTELLLVKKFESIEE